MSPRTRSNITWAKCGIASLVGATLCPCSEPSGLYISERINCAVFVYGRVSSQTIDYSVNWGHDVLLDATHDLLD